MTHQLIFLLTLGLLILWIGVLSILRSDNFVEWLWLKYSSNKAKNISKKIDIVLDVLVSVNAIVIAICMYKLLLPVI